VIRRHAAALHLALALVDAGSAAALFVLLSIVRFGGDAWQDQWAEAGIAGGLAAILYGLAWTAALAVQGLYRLRARWSVRRELIDIAIAALLLAVGMFTLLFWFKLPDISRLFLVSLFAAQIALTLALRLAIRFAFTDARSRGFNARYLLIVGTGPAAVSFADRIVRHRDLGLRPIGFVAGPDEPAGSDGVTAAGPILGRLDDIGEILHGQIVDEVAICLPASQWAMVEPIARVCLEEGKLVRIPEVEGLSVPGARRETFDGIDVLFLVYGPDRAFELIAKRAIDIAGAALGLVLLSPLLAAIGLAILARDGRPVLFHQTRIGLHGRPFRIAKFRTMIPDAETRLPELAESNELAGPVFKITDDPRISRTGRWLRRFSLDELPQLWNVLRGEMSLVGPRPPLPQEVSDYDIWHRRRLSMKPGMTGLWQVSARREQEFDRWVELDLNYIDRWSLWLDLKIMVRTPVAMLQGR
jgi:exopolysaccharide biosynthesis polyprenyl glycosylphosphotransferase